MISKHEQISTIRERIEDVHERMESAAARAGRNVQEIRLMAATKTQSSGTVRAAYEAGIRLFGENRVLEASEKYNNFFQDAELHMIGHLQRNKADTAAATFSCIQSIDKVSTVRALEKYLNPEGPGMDILLEFNTSREESKNGCRNEDELYALIDEIIGSERISITGLMTIGPFTDDEIEVHRAFSLLRVLSEKVSARYSELRLRELSMGMSSDYEIAIEEGSTIIRLGTTLFGKRI